MTAMLRLIAASSAILLTLPLDDTRDRPLSARYNGGVAAEQPQWHTHTQKCIKNSKKLIGAFENVCLTGAL